MKLERWRCIGCGRLCETFEDAEVCRREDDRGRRLFDRLLPSSTDGGFKLLGAMVGLEHCRAELAKIYRAAEPEHAALHNGEKCPGLTCVFALARASLDALDEVADEKSKAEGKHEV